MLFPNPSQDLFRTALPDTFFDAEIEYKYDKWLQAYPQYFTKFRDCMNESLQSFELPAINITPITQSLVDANKNITINSLPKTSIQEAIDKTLTIEFRLADGYINYFFMMEHFYKKYDDGDERDFGNWAFQTMDRAGFPVMEVTFNNIIFTGLSGLTLSHANDDQSFQTFTCTFYFSTFDVGVNVPELKL